MTSSHSPQSNAATGSTGSTPPNAYSRPLCHKLVLVPLIIGIALGLLLAWAGSLPAALLSFCMFTAGAHIVGDKNAKTCISFLGLIVVVIASFQLVSKTVIKVDEWYAVKIVFVVYFSLFAGYLLTTYVTRGNKYPQLALLASIMLICFFIKFAGQETAVVEQGWAKQIYDFFKVLHEGKGIYKWPDLIEDVFFGIAGVLAAELYK